MNGTAARPVLGEWSLPREFAPDSWGDDTRFTQSRRERRAMGYVRQAFYVAIDVVLVCAGTAVAYGARFGFTRYFGIQDTPASQWLHHSYTHAYPAFLLLYVTLVVMACANRHLYRTSREISALRESISVAKAVGFATVLLVLFIFISGNKEISRLVVAWSGVLTVAVLAGWRYAKRVYILRRARRGQGLSRVLVIGAGHLGHALASWMERNRQLGYSVCGFLDAHPNGDSRVLGSIQDLRRVALEQFVDQVFLTLPADRELVKETWVQARRMRLDFNVVPDLYDGLGWRAPVKSIGGFPVIELHGQPIPALGLAAKRVFDVIGASLGLLLAAPLLALSALWICADSRGPIFYTALRVGRKGTKFRCYKLRTMVTDAEAQKDVLRQSNERNGPFFKMINDPRITRCGRWLRRYSIDELPQLVNVLRGDMSFVGPRPHPLDDYERYSVEHLRRLDVKPGLTGLWQVTARSDPSFETNMALDLEYIENWSLRLDVRILLKTIPAVLRAEGR